MIKKIPYPALLGFELVDFKFGEARLKVQMRDELRQPYGVLHGGATASLIDTAMAFACISCLPEGERTTTVDLTVHYLRPVVDETITCTAKIVRAATKFSSAGE